jgi:hypothetical protein
VGASRVFGANTMRHGNRLGTTGSSVETLAFWLRLSSVPEAPGYSMSLYVDDTGEPLPNWLYARVPCEVVCDPSLKALDIRVYCMLAGSVWQGATAKIGTRLIANCIHASRRLVAESLLRLETRGHVMKAGARRGTRPTYLLTSPVFCAETAGRLRRGRQRSKQNSATGKHKEVLMGS